MSRPFLISQALLFRIEFCRNSLFYHVFSQKLSCHPARKLNTFFCRCGKFVGWRPLCIQRFCTAKVPHRQSAMPVCSRRMEKAALLPAVLPPLLRSDRLPGPGPNAPGSPIAQNSHRRKQQQDFSCLPARCMLY